MTNVLLSLLPPMLSLFAVVAAYFVGRARILSAAKVQHS